MAYREVSRVEIAEVVRPLAVGQQPAADSDRYGAVEGDSPQVHRGGHGSGSDTRRCCSE